MARVPKHSDLELGSELVAGKGSTEAGDGECGLIALFEAAASELDGEWVPAVYLQYLSSRLSDLAHRRIMRILCTMPPRHAKSSLCSDGTSRLESYVLPLSLATLIALPISEAANLSKETSADGSTK